MGKEETLGFAALAEAKARCTRILHRIEQLPSSTNIAPSSKQTLLRLALSELSFLSASSSSSSSPFPISFNVGHLEAVVHILEQPFVSGVSRVCKPIPFPAAADSRGGTDGQARTRGVHVDIACNVRGKPVWFIVSDRNPKHISWEASGRSNSKGLRRRVEQVLAAARSSVALKPSSVVLFFSKGLDDFICGKFRDEFGAAKFEMAVSDIECEFAEEFDGDWVNVVARSFQAAHALEIGVDHVEYNASFVTVSKPCLYEEKVSVDSCDTFASLIRVMKSSHLKVKDLSGKGNLINFDTTALIALVSGISNGGTGRLLSAEESELRQRFKGNCEFVIAQAKSEIQKPIHAELLEIACGRRGIICETVHSEFKELVSMCGGPNETLRANLLLKHFIVVPDSPSSRIMGLPTTRKLALKNKIVFGTGDHWCAPTLSANMAFARAVSQTGLSLSTIEHRPRALTGD